MAAFADEEDEDDVGLVAPRLDDDNVADGEDEDGEGLVAGEIKGVKSKQKRAPRLRVNSEHILDKRTGLHRLVEMFEGFEARGSGREAADIDRMLRKCEIWASGLVPGMKLSLADFVARVNRGGAGLKRSDLNAHLRDMREAEAERAFGSLFSKAKGKNSERGASDDESDIDLDARNDDNRQTENTNKRKEVDDGAGASSSANDVAERIRKNREAALARRRALLAAKADGGEANTVMEVSPESGGEAASPPENRDQGEHRTQSKSGDDKDGDTGDDLDAGPKELGPNADDSKQEKVLEDDLEEEDEESPALTLQKRRKILVDSDDEDTY